MLVLEMKPEEESGLSDYEVQESREEALEVNRHGRSRESAY